jgi:hypothetical protein
VLECASPLALSEGFGVIGTDKRPMLEVETIHEPRPTDLGFMVPMRAKNEWRVTMNLVGDEVTSLTFLSAGKEDQRLVTSSPTGLF